jgi:DNA-binding CsgD family transcriptional regulator
MYDHLGSGLSDRTRYDYSLDGLVAEIEAVVEAEGLERFGLFAGAVSVPAAIRYAAENPDRVACLVINCGWAWTKEGRTYRTMREGLEQDWGLLSEVLARIVAGVGPSPAVEAAIRDATDAITYRDYQLAIEHHDVRNILGLVRVPTLVMQQTGNRFHPESQGRALVEGIPGAHICFYPFPPADGIHLALAMPFFREHWPTIAVASPVALHPASELTAREAGILRLIAEGASNADIAGSNSLSIRTVERHVQNIYAKLDVHNRVEAANWAREHNLV